MNVIEEATTITSGAGDVEGGVGQQAAAPHLAMELLERLTERDVPQLSALKAKIGMLAYSHLAVEHCRHAATVEPDV